MSRYWASLYLGHGVRIGRSFGSEDFEPRPMPKWRRYELAKKLQAAAVAKGQAMTLVEAGYMVDKAIDCGLLDSNGGLNFNVRGETKDECVKQIMDIGATWGEPLSLSAAEQMFNTELAKTWTWERLAKAIGVPLLIVLAVAQIAIWLAF